MLAGLMAICCPFVAAHAEDAPAALVRAQSLEHEGHSAEAIPLYLQVLHLDPQSAQAELGLGRCQYSLRDYSQAAASFKHALELRPGDTEILNWLGRSYLQESLPQKVLELVSRQEPAARDSAAIHLLLARAYDAQDKLDDSVREIQGALKLDPRLHGAHFAWGFIAWSTGDMTMAERQLRQELALDPHEGLAAFYLAAVLEKQGKLSEAEAALAQMGRDSPNTYLYHLGLGKIYEREKKYPPATEQYQEAIRLEPQQLEAHYRRAMVLRARGETAKSNEEFQTFSRLQSQSDDMASQGMGRMRPRIPDFN